MSKLITLLTTLYQWRNSRLFLILVVLIAAIFSGSGLTKYVLWDDESLTASYAVNLLKLGKVNGWDGKNLVSNNLGEDLDKDLNQKELAPLQYFVAAASIKIFGTTTFAARFPFWLIGIITIFILYFVCKEIMSENFPHILPPLIASLSVTYALFIIQSHYYSLLLLATTLLLYSLSLLRSDKDPKLFKYALSYGIFSSLLLLFSYPLGAISVIISSYMILFLKDYRHKQTLTLLFTLTIITIGLLLTMIIKNDAGTILSVHSYSQPFWIHFYELLILEFTGLSSHEFIPLLLIPFLFIPWFKDKFYPLRPFSHIAFTFMAMIMIIMVIVALLSPQNLELYREYADERYILPVIILGYFISAIAITIISASLGYNSAILFFIILIFSNIFYFPSPQLRCTFCNRIEELLEDHPSGDEAYVLALKTLPFGTSAALYPQFILPVGLFYRPDITFYGSLRPDKIINPKIRQELPPYVYSERAEPDYFITGASTFKMVDNFNYHDKHYRLATFIHYNWVDWTRPEIPRRRFKAQLEDDQKSGIAVFYLEKNLPLTPVD